MFNVPMYQCLGQAFKVINSVQDEQFVLNVVQYGDFTYLRI